MENKKNEKMGFMKTIENFLSQIKFLDTQVSWYEVLQKFIKKLTQYDIDQRATSVAYGFMLALFPLILVFFTLIPYIPVADLEEQIMSFLHGFIPEGIYEFTEQTIRDIVSRPQAGVLSVSFILTLYSAMNGMVSLMRSFNIMYQEDNSRTFLHIRGTAIMLLIMMSLVLLLMVILVIVGGLVTDYVIKANVISSSWVIYAFTLARYLLAFSALNLGIALIYRYGPDVRVPIRFFSPGVYVASMLIIATSYGFSYYLSNFSSYNKLYGSIGTIIALMLWLYLIALILIFGYELNASIAEAKEGGDKEFPMHDKG